MTIYASVEDIEAGFRLLSEDESSVASRLLEEAAVIIDAYNREAAADAKQVVSCRMARRAIGDGGSSGVPIGATQGSMSALGYSTSWSNVSGGSGELYLGKLEKKLLGCGDRIGSYSPVEDMAVRT